MYAIASPPSMTYSVYILRKNGQQEYLLIISTEAAAVRMQTAKPYRNSDGEDPAISDSAPQIVKERTS